MSANTTTLSLPGVFPANPAAALSELYPDFCQLVLQNTKNYNTYSF